CGPDTNISQNNLYTHVGKNIYTQNSTLYGNWTSFNVLPWGGTIKQGDVITLELNIEEKTLKAWLNSTAGPGLLISKNIPDCDTYHFYASAYALDDQIQVLDYAPL